MSESQRLILSKAINVIITAIGTIIGLILGGN